MLYKVCFWFLVFVIYSFLGWCMEVVGKLIEKHRFINRGFLIGPVCPIYGSGAILISFLINRYSDNIFILFISSVFICSILEYLTSYIMEKIFHTRWWDYTRRKFNINGRICLETMIPFGILGCLIIKVFTPAIFNSLLRLDNNILIDISVFVAIILLVDFVISTCIIYNFRNTIKNVERDATEEITKKVKDIFLQKGYLFRRLITAFPTMTTNKDRLLILKDKVNNELKKIEEKRKETIDTIKSKVNK